jgi:hypothetical protein
MTASSEVKREASVCELLGNCFWREGLEAAFGAERRGWQGRRRVICDRLRIGFLRTQIVSGVEEFFLLKENTLTTEDTEAQRKYSL